MLIVCVPLQEENTIVTSELIIKKMSLAQLTGGLQGRDDLKSATN